MAHVNCFVQFQNPSYTLKSRSPNTLNKCVFSVDFESVGAQIATIAHIHIELCDSINDLVWDANYGSFQTCFLGVTIFHRIFPSPFCEFLDVSNF